MFLNIEQGEPLCIFYSRYGICKFGPSCKFDHPMGVFTYNLSPNSSDRQHNMLASASGGSGVLNITSQGNMEGVSVTLSERIQMPSNDNSIDHQE